MRACSFVLAVALASAPAVAWASEPDASADDPALDKLRERFKDGSAKYQAERYGEAILVWSPIYQELGPSKGYRLAFNLGCAYDLIPDEPRAADHLEAYVIEVERREKAGELLPAVVLEQRDEATKRLDELRTKLARLRFHGLEALVAIDRGEVKVARGTAYVTPRKHVVVYRPSTPEQSRIDVDAAAGAIVDLETPALPEKPVVMTSAPTMRWETHQERPFPKSILFVGAGVTALSFVVPPLLYANALGTKDDYEANPSSDLRDDYSSKRTAAYTSWALPALLGTATIALALYWYYGEKTVRTPVALAF